MQLAFVYTYKVAGRHADVQAKPHAVTCMDVATRPFLHILLVTSCINPSHLKYSHVGPCLAHGSDESCRSPTIHHVTWEPGAPDACYMRGFTLSIRRGTAFPPSPPITEPTRLASVKHTTLLPSLWLYLTHNSL